MHLCGNRYGFKLQLRFVHVLLPRRPILGIFSKMLVTVVTPNIVCCRFGFIPQHGAVKIETVSVHEISSGENNELTTPVRYRR